MSAHERAAEEIADEFYRVGNSRSEEIDAVQNVLQRHFPDWQDISSAPRDGTVFDVTVKESGERRADYCWWDMGRCFKPTNPRGGRCFDEWELSHWKPIGPLPGRVG
ncbi:hypothetical protein TSACC_21694 [Terrimicrobium sacchariphilum]|uniref:Uncharacterized protein n=1 Tax=Terrimicrobium sacchariphilum TaxID=690879 RepID=A0A146G701_TERSA|nr:hypothetical protein TSACC_21694 [Terrimicrobium sacchariphilum]